MSSKPVVVQLTLSKAGFSQGISSAQREMRQLQASAQQMGHGTVSSMQASSAAIRVLEGGITGNIRAAERFIGMLPGVGAALKAAFPLVGGLALAGVFVKIGEEAVNFIQKMNEIPANPFEGLISSAKLSNDQLAITNDRLAMEIAKLEHKPVNGMALALDQARESSDKLFESLTKANAAFTEAMGKSNISTFKGLWNNMAPTDAANKDIARARSGVQAVTTDHQPAINDALASGNKQNVDQAREALMVDLQKAYAQQDNALRAGLAAAQAKQADFTGAYHVGSDQSKVIEKYQAAIAQSANEQGEAGGNYGQSIMQPKKDALDASRANQEAADEAQRKLVQQWRQNLDEQKADNDMTIAQEAQFWVQRMESVKKGSISYIAALDEANKDIAKMRAENVRGQAGFDKTSSGIYATTDDLSKSDTGTMKEQGRDATEYLKALNQGISIHNSNADAIAKESLQMAVMTGQMSKLDATQLLATLHTQEYMRAQDALQSALAAANELPDSLSKQATIAGLNNQGAQMDAQRQIQVAQDQQSVASQQLGPAMTQELGRMANAWTNMTEEIVQVMTRAANSFNDDIVKAMTGRGKASDFGKSFSQAGEGLLKAGLQNAEGSALKALHIGAGPKPDGTQSNRIYTYTILEGGGSAAGGAGSIPLPAGIAGSALGHIPGFSGSALSDFVRPFIGGNPTTPGTGIPGTQGQSGGAGGSVWSRLIGAFIPGIGHLGSSMPKTDDFGFPVGFQGGFADGGNVIANHPLLLGERGPEMYVPNTAGRIVPNSALGGGGDTHIHVDARGSNDPAAIHAAVMRAAPHIIAASVQTQHSASKRSPSGR